MLLYFGYRFYNAIDLQLLRRQLDKSGGNMTMRVV